MSKLKKPKKLSRTKLLKKLDKIFSEHIRKRDDGQCYTCPKKDEWKYMQCGHYIPRNILRYRYDLRNNHTQCVGCNVFQKGNYTVYALRLIQEYGTGLLEEFERGRREVYKVSNKQLEDLIQGLK